MSQLDIASMQTYLTRSYSSINSNKLNGLLAEIDFRNYLTSLGFANHVSVGGWVARSEGSGSFGHNTVAIFPETIQPSVPYPLGRKLPTPSQGLHTICGNFHQIGIHSFFCAPEVQITNNPASVTWKSIQLGVPTTSPYLPFPLSIAGFRKRAKRYNFLKYKTPISTIPVSCIPEEFSKEHLRVTFQDVFLAEVSDIDGIFWGSQLTYPIEIKEKTAATSPRLGPYFGLDLGPFVKLAFYAAKRGNLQSIFVVREIDNVTSRKIVNWWYIKFDQLAQFASWNRIGGGKNMGGGQSTVVAIPKAEFQQLDAAALKAL